MGSCRPQSVGEVLNCCPKFPRLIFTHTIHECHEFVKGLLRLSQNIYNLFFLRLENPQNDFLFA